ncbi:hypothetical protein Tco_0319333 [Tanacetum coccineum]
MSAYSFTMHHLASCLPSILHTSCMVSYKDDLYKLLLVHVMVAPTIPVSAEENLEDLIDIRMDIIHLELIAAVAFPAVTVVRTLARHGERANRVEIEEITLRARVRSLELIETWLHGIVRDEREARERMERQLGLIQEELESLRRSRLP